MGVGGGRPGCVYIWGGLAGSVSAGETFFLLSPSQFVFHLR